MDAPCVAMHDRGMTMVVHTYGIAIHDHGTTMHYHADGMRWHDQSRWYDDP